MLYWKCSPDTLFALLVLTAIMLVMYGQMYLHRIVHLFLDRWLRRMRL